MYVYNILYMYIYIYLHSGGSFSLSLYIYIYTCWYRGQNQQLARVYSSLAIQHGLSNGFIRPVAKTKNHGVSVPWIQKTDKTVTLWSFNIAIENDRVFFNGKTHYKGQFSIAM